MPIKIGGQSLPAGVYGIGFIAGDKFVVTDVGAHDVLTVSSSTDQDIKRPVPLAGHDRPGGGFRLYDGRKYVTFSRYHNQDVTRLSNKKADLSGPPSC